MYRLYDFAQSGNCYKVRLLLNQLEIPFERVEVNLLEQQTRSLEFLQKNPNGKLLLLEIEPAVFLSESNAILLYLAEGTPLLPTTGALSPKETSLERFQVMQWLFFEQFSLCPNISRPRFFISVVKKPDQVPQLIDYWQSQGNQALKMMDQHLEAHSFLVGDRYTIADIALFAYTHLADEGGFALSQFPAIRAWMERVTSQPEEHERPTTLAQYLEALHRRDQSIIAWEQFFNQWDVLLCPLSMVTAFPHCEAGSPLHVDSQKVEY